MGILIIWVWWCGVIQLKSVGDGKGSRLSMAKPFAGTGLSVAKPFAEIINQ